MENNRKIKASFILVIILIVTNLLWAWAYFHERSELADQQSFERAEMLNTKVVGFLKMFIDDVLLAQQEVSFDTRLKLENAVRDLNDSEALAQWDKFINSKTEAEAQQEVKKLLSMLVNKVQVASE
ncbi:MAG TPA: hypothetical protein PKN73_03115 [Candidatus Paceibacterota bacterium]|jgi:hypothetical protein|nr:hypothetical protein [Candidatus Paceibacterota bacterium]HOH11581.1 hypothetical protein [Candidatus Paceibacterota bacterium]HOY11411.1 hypothetical protein [Candidatus Paceibacterota bacterium]HPB60659.1 hypothetical protein [Candidatus Paceibacterota bacterium]HPI24751.1 hypothetical protein [Candidatus Paceibacterota bacterium]